MVIEAIRQVLADELPLHTLDLTTPVKDQFVQDLFGLLPPALAAEAKISSAARLAPTRWKPR